MVELKRISAYYRHRSGLPFVECSNYGACLPAFPPLLCPSYFAQRLPSLADLRLLCMLSYHYRVSITNHGLAILLRKEWKECGTRGREIGEREEEEEEETRRKGVDFFFNSLIGASMTVSPPPASYSSTMLPAFVCALGEQAHNAWVFLCMSE